MTEEKQNDDKKQKKHAKKSVDQEIEALAKKAEELGVPFLEKVPDKANKESIQMLTEDLAQQHQMVVFSVDKKENMMHVAMVNHRTGCEECCGYI